MLRRETQEALIRRYGGDESLQMIKEAFNQRRITAAIHKFFGEQRTSATVIYVDIASFSRTIAGYSPRQVRQFLDHFYSIAIPWICETGGEIDRIMGDGIIAVYSQAFRMEFPWGTPEATALNVAMNIVEETNGTDHKSKAAISSGEVLLCKTGIADLYEDYTIIGHPLTEVYRLEAIAEANQVLLRRDGPLASAINSILFNGTVERIVNPTVQLQWLVTEHAKLSLPGLEPINVARFHYSPGCAEN